MNPGPVPLLRHKGTGVQIAASRVRNDENAKKGRAVRGLLNAVRVKSSGGMGLFQTLRLQ